MGEPFLSRLGAWVASTEHNTLPEASLRAARYQVLNMTAAAHAAGDSAACRQIEAAAAATASQGRSTVLASGRSLPPVEAAWVNAAYAMAQDFDDIVWMGHTCHSSVFAPLAVAEHEGAPSSEALAAVVVANEIGGRLGASSFLGPLNGQMWSFIHLVGAAAATARLLKLDATRAAHALAISLAQPNFVLQPGFFRPTSKLLTASTPIATGIRAAYLAREGVTGALDIIEDPKGFWRRFAFRPLPEMLEDLGTFWTVQTLSVKTFPGCFYFQTTCSAIATLLRDLGPLRPEQVESVRIDTTKLGTEVTRFARDYAGEGLSPVNINFDLSLTAAVMLQAGRLTSREHDEAWLASNAEAILRWRELIQVRHDASLTARLIASARGIDAGRKAIGALRPTDIARIVARYREEYRSSLVSPDEVASWVKAAASSAVSPPQDAAHVRHSPSALPLYFPGRVTIKLRDGRRAVAQVDLPVGSFCAPEVERELREKFVRESTPTLGAAQALAAFEAGLRLESGPLSDFVRLASPRSQAGSPAGSLLSHE